ncbi:MAG TPA: hypothetical protein VL137_01895 [Polyangiaceae bacterium]|nr:hypothetical protein [Polyangiaceae bacterium]
MKLTQLTLLIGTLALAAGCTSSSSSGGGTNTNHHTNGDASTTTGGDASTTTGGDAAVAPGPATTSKRITAAAGGTVALSDGAGVSIPAGALNADTTVTISSAQPVASLPDRTTVHGLTYNFGPNGTTFNDPVTLTLPLVGTPGANEQAVVSWLNTNTNKWEDLATTTANGKVTAKPSHFTLFVVRFAVPAGSGDAGGSFTCDFASCTGGDIVGTWAIQGACFDFPNPFEGQCSTSTFNFDTQFTGSATYKADGTWTSAITTGGNVTFTFPVECLRSLFGDAGAPATPISCQQLFGDSFSDDAGAATCTGDSSTGCECTKPVATKTEMGSGTYTVSGSTLTSTDDSDGSVETSEFCITGSNIKVQQVNTKDGGDGPSTVVWSAVKQ